MQLFPIVAPFSAHDPYSQYDYYERQRQEEERQRLEEERRRQEEERRRQQQLSSYYELPRQSWTYIDPYRQGTVPDQVACHAPLTASLFYHRAAPKLQ